MKLPKKFQALGIVAGIALFVAAGLLTMVAARSAPGKFPPVPPINPAVTAPGRALSDAFAAVAAHVRPAVVSVYSEKMIKYQTPNFSLPFGGDFFQQFFGNQFHGTTPQAHPQQRMIPQRGMGSGMILDKEGHILTNYHVVQDVDSIKVRLADKREFTAEVVSTDARTDLAVIKLKGRVPEDLPNIEFGDSDKLRVGDIVMAVGAPFGYVQTVTEGIISATGRSNIGIEDYEDFLQTDAPINPGNSGGPLVNLDGQVIGMNTAIATSVGQFAGVGFAIPANMIQTILPTLLQGKKITRGMLGVVIQEITADLAKKFNLPNTNGALVAQVNPNSPAAKAGLKTGDVITRYDGHDIENTSQLRNLAAATAPGTKIKIEALRDGKTETFTATIGKLASQTTASAPAEEGGSELGKLGLNVQTLTPDLAKEFGYDENAHGVLIASVDDGSVAALAGLQSDDLILEADRHKVTSVDELKTVLAEAKDKAGVLLLINRKGQSLFVVLQTS